MRSSIRDILRRNSRTCRPQPTGWQPVLARLPGIKAVLFDVYGTLFDLRFIDARVGHTRGTDAQGRKTYSLGTSYKHF
mgnify:CR=1 FL=1